MSGDFRAHLDDKEMREYLGALDEKGVTKILRKGLMKGGAVYRSAIRDEAPVKGRAGAGAHGTFTVRKRGGYIEKDYGTPGGLKASVKVRRIRSNPAIGVVVGPMGKTAFMRHWITQGTKAHLIRPRGSGGFLRVLGGFVRLVHHPGSKANAFVGRGIARANDQALDVAEQTIFDEAEKATT